MLADNARPLPRALLAMQDYLEQAFPGLNVSPDTPKTRPNEFVTIDLLPGSEHHTGLYAEPVFAIQCYAMNTGRAEQLSQDVLAQCKAAQFKLFGDVQFRGWTTVSTPYPFPDPLVADRRRWQFTGRLGMSNRKKGI